MKDVFYGISFILLAFVMLYVSYKNHTFSVVGKSIILIAIVLGVIAARRESKSQTNKED